jgi:hypothetical protein
MTAAPASADPPRNRYERRAEKHSHYRRGQQRRSGRSHPGGGSYSNRRDYGRRPAAPGIPPHLVDMDSDGIPNLRDRDQDGDGVPNHRDRYPRDERRR